MSDVINILLQEHRNISRVLDLIQRQAANLASRAPVNYRLLESCFQYLSSYPEKCHHPKEDLVYRKLRSNCPDIVDSLRDLVDEHETLAYFTRNLRRSIAVVQHQLPTVNTPLAEQLTTYLDAYHLHMATEEKCFFPLALKRLSHDELAEIDFTLFDQPDHLFDREAEAKLAELHRAISQSGAVEDLRADHREEAAWLAALHDIANFNDAMQRAGDPVLLARSSSGGYELKDGGQVLLYIPPCSESRAAWCAYYYRKATNPPDNVFTIDRAG
ncbi:MAG: hemerythrin domain-containing protein [Betaproteobacteria bacterium]|nr:hemerythrin domain-containing protein [Betaproteobacteria bacterium]